jgi:serine/threonine protein kinase/TPR repeat protein
VDTFTPGDTIDGKYTIDAVLGKGGMGLVLSARRPGLSTLVAIKVLLPELRDKPEIAGRFAREARVADSLRSEHVARVLDVGATPAGTPYIVMEHLAGQDLAALIAARGQLPVAEAADLLLQACEAIGEAHTHGIVHRDLKPANLFVTTSVDGLPFVKVLDFGIAKATSADDLVVTKTEAFFGSPYYMSPEQLTGPKNVDARTDVWALGIILYEMLTGVAPFKGETLHIVYAAIVLGKYAKLSEARDDVPADLEALVAEALASKPDDRVPTVEAFAKKLATFGTSRGRQSYERIERLSGGATHADQPRSAPVASLLAETGDALAHSGVLTDSPLVRTEPPVPPVKPRSRLAPALAALVGLAAVGGGVMGYQRLHQAPPPVASSSPPVPDVAPSSNAVASAPSASAAPAASEAPVAASSPSAAPPAAALAKPASAPTAPISKATGECAKGATPACEAACAAHAPGRCEALAKALVKGTGAPKDVARAVKLFQQECDAGSGSACNSLGALYGAGTEVTKDEAHATRLYKQGCDHESLTACVNFGSMLFDGSGTAKNQPLALTYFLRGCPSSGPAEAAGCLNASVAYDKGLGAPKDPSQAFGYAKLACDAGAPRGCSRMSLAKITGEGTTKDVPGGIGELDASCGRGEPSACSTLVTLFLRGQGTDVAADPARARAVADKGCKAHDAQSCKSQSQLATVDNGEANIALNNGQLETGCNAGVLANCSALGDRVYSGQGVPADRVKAVALWDKACKGGVQTGFQKVAGAGR